MTELHKALSRYFGLHSFKKGQEEIMTSVLQKRYDRHASDRRGKSLCYQLPGYMMDGLVLIISPLLSLMEDQVQQLKAKGEKRVAALNSMLNSAERHFILSNISRYKFLYMSPEALSSPYVLNRLKMSRSVYLLLMRLIAYQNGDMISGLIIRSSDLSGRHSESRLYWR